MSPEKRAAVSFVPSMRMVRPKLVHATINPATAAHTRNTTRGMGTRPTTFAVNTVLNAGGSPETGLPSVRTRATPPKSSRVPRVARMGGILRIATRMPLMRPHTTPTTRATPSAMRTAIPMDEAVAGPVRVARRVRAAQMPVTLAMATTDRSMPAVNMVNMTPRLMRPNSGNWTAMDCQVRTAKKGPGRTAAKKMSRSRKTMTRRAM